MSVEVYRRKWFLLYFSCLFPNKRGRECTAHAYCMELHLCSTVFNSGIISLMIIGRGVYEQNRTVNVGAASWVKIQMTIRINGEAEMTVSVRGLEWQEVNGNLHQIILNQVKTPKRTFQKCTQPENSFSADLNTIVILKTQWLQINTNILWWHMGRNDTLSSPHTKVWNVLFSEIHQDELHAVDLKTVYFKAFSL